MKILVLLLIPLLAGCLETAERLPFDYSEDKFQKALDSGNPVVLEVGADWCQVCIDMQPVMERLQERYPGVEFFLADYDRRKGIVREYGVRATPSFIFFDSGGKVLKIEGYQEESTMEKLVLKYLYNNYTFAEAYSTYSRLGAPQVEIHNGKAKIGIEVKDNFTVWNNELEIVMNGIQLQPLNTSPQITRLENEGFKRRPLSPGRIEIEAPLPRNYTRYNSLVFDIVIPVWDENCPEAGCLPRRDYILGATLEVKE